MKERGSEGRRSICVTGRWKRRTVGERKWRRDEEAVNRTEARAQRVEKTREKWDNGFVNEEDGNRTLLRYRTEVHERG
jgi:hypothetical protein